MSLLDDNFGTPSSWLNASQLGVSARKARAKLKSQIAEDPRIALRAIEEGRNCPDSLIARMRVSDVLIALPGIGEIKRDRLMYELGISSTKRICGLGQNQYVRLKRFLEDRLRHMRFDIDGEAPGEINRLTILAGPTAVGKGTVVTQILRDHPDVFVSISTTTRPPRPTERPGVDYNFTDDLTFDQMIRDDKFLEWATVHGRYRYGTPREPIEEALKKGLDVLLEIDLIGCRQVRKSIPTARTIMLLPPTWEELVRRLLARDSESVGERELRLATARREIEAQKEFNHVVVNKEIAVAAEEVYELMHTN